LSVSAYRYLWKLPWPWRFALAWSSPSLLVLAMADSTPMWAFVGRIPAWR
jgi:hypothetical protein